MSKFIVIEGLEGAGKSSAIAVLEKVIQSFGKRSIKTREPGGTPLAEALRRLWKEGVAGEVPTLNAEVLMLYAARAQLVEKVIKPYLEQGIFVIGDRHNASTIAYQGGGRGIDCAFLDQIKRSVLGDFLPDCTIFLDVEPQLGLDRAKSRGSLDRIEQQELDFFIRTRQAYLDYFQHQKDVLIIDANRPLEIVSQDIEEQFYYWMLQNFNK